MPRSIAEEISARTGKPIGSRENFEYLLNLAIKPIPIPKEPPDENLARKKDPK